MTLTGYHLRYRLHKSKRERLKRVRIRAMKKVDASIAVAKTERYFEETAAMGALQELSAKLNGYQASADNKKMFRFWHVEALLNQASDLLDRCVQERRELQDLDARAAEQDLLLSRALGEKALVQTRLANKYYDLQFDILGQSSGKFDEHISALSGAAGSAKEWRDQGPTLERDTTMYSTRAEYLAAQAESIARSLRQNMEFSDKALQADFAQVAVTTADDRANQSAAGGALNFDDQIRSLQERITEDFQDAYDRLSLAQVGLTRLYGYDEPLPSGPPTANQPLSLLDRSLLWCRAAIRWLAATQQYEQVFSRVFSVRGRLSEGPWKDAMTRLKNAGSAVAHLYLDPNEVITHRYVRFRGVAAYSYGTDDTLAIELALPEFGVSIQKKGGVVERKEIDQQDLPTCVMGRISNRTNARPPEVAGTNSLMNASPFGFANTLDGQMALTLSWASRNPAKALQLPEDIELELVLAGLPV